MSSSAWLRATNKMPLRKMENKLFIRGIFCILLFLPALNVQATTDYIVLERHADIHIFEKYIDYLSTTKDPVALFQAINMNDEALGKILKEYSNTISNVWYSKDNFVVIENKKFGFEIHFVPEIIKNSIYWKCDIVDDSIIFNPRECHGWKKEINF